MATKLNYVATQSLLLDPNAKAHDFIISGGDAYEMQRMIESRAVIHNLIDQTEESRKAKLQAIHPLPLRSANFSPFTLENKKLQENAIRTSQYDNHLREHKAKREELSRQHKDDGTIVTSHEAFKLQPAQELGTGGPRENGFQHSSVMMRDLSTHQTATNNPNRRKQ